MVIGRMLLRLIFISVFFVGSPLGFAQGGLDQAEAIGPFLNGNLPSEAPRPATGNWTLTNAFPNLTFIDPVQMIPVPGTNQLMVVEKNGRLAVFENDPNAVSKTVLFDISANVQSTHDSGMVGVAFHPEFGQAGSPNRDFLYVYYRYTPDKSETNKAYCRLSRFTWQLGTPTIATGSEFILINQYDRHNWHNGGGLFFGADGFLYLSIGDEGGANDVYNSGQKMNLGLLAGVLRIDVDQDLSRSHAILRQPLNPATPPSGWPDSYSQGYTIPDDNPWLSPDGSQLEEFYAIGLRSPHRMTLDPVTNRIWVGDVGQSAREEVSLVEKGANLQWPYRQGDIAGPKPKPNPLTGFDQPPVWAYSRTEGGCVIGGYVYRGTAHPDLHGKYLVGDHNNGKIRALTHTPGQAPVIEELLTLSRHGPGPKNGLGSFGIDANGEVYVLALAGTDQDGGIIYKLDRTGPGIPEPPALLSQTGAFQDLAALTPSPGIIPYDLIQPLWSDGADKQRWIAIPNDGNPNSPGEQIGFSENGEWSFPIGTVLIKHFEIAGRRLETRFFVHGNDGQYYGVTYQWRADGSEADLLPGPPVDEEIDLGGGQSIDWHFPGRTECFSCHTQAAGIVLGPKTRHLNRDHFYAVTGRTANQITTFNQLGFLSPPPVEAAIPGFLTSANVADLSETLDRRARSYLDINCSQCHRPNGPTQAVFDTRLTTPSNLQNMINVVPADDLGVPGARIVKPQSPAESVLHLRVNSLGGCCAMPPLAKNAVDTEAVQAIADWINSLDPDGSPPGAIPGLQYEYFEGNFSRVPDFSSLTPDKSGDVANLDLSPRLSNDTFAFRFFGQLNIVTAGDYTFFLTSDDGSILSLDGSVAIDHDGFHPAYPKSATVTLGVGAHALEVAYFESYGGETLTLEIQGPGLARQPVPDTMLTRQSGGGGPVNQPPVLAAISNQNTDLGNSVNLLLSATDPENGALTFSATGLPAGSSINPATGAITGSPTAATVTQVTATVEDPEGATDSESFTWIVTDPGSGAQAGLVYDYYEGDFSQVPDFAALTPDKSGIAPNFDLSPRLSDDTHAFRFLGNITIPAQGDYTLHLTSDDGSILWLNGVLVIDNDGYHSAFTRSATVALGAGVHGIEVGFFESYGEAVLNVEIEGPGLPRQPIPDGFLTHGGAGGGNLPPDLFTIPGQSTAVDQPVSLALVATDPNGDPLTFSATGLPAGLSIDPATGEISGTPGTSSVFDVTATVDDGNGATDSESFTWLISEPGGPGGLPGIRYEYFEQEFSQLPDFSTLTPVDSGVVSDFTLAPRLQDDQFAFRFSGDIAIPVTGDYTFRLTSDDGSRLWIDGIEIVNNDGAHDVFERSGTVNLAAGSHTIDVGYFEAYGGEILIVEIEGPGLPRQPIPGSLLTHSPSGGSEAGNADPASGGSQTGGGGSGSTPRTLRGVYGRLPDRPSLSDLTQNRTRFQPDNWIGTRRTRQLGNDVYNTTGNSQSITLRIPRSQSRGFYFTVQNDRRVSDDLTVTGSRRHGKYRLSYLRMTSPPINFTTEITTGRHRIENLSPSARHYYKVRVKMTRRSARHQPLRGVYIQSASDFQGLGRDRIKANLRKGR